MQQMMLGTAARLAVLTLMSVGLSACGGGSDDSGASLSPAPTPVTNSQRIQAATATAQSNAACTAVQPFYWEVGDRSVSLASGSVGATSPNSATQLLIASASKWMFGAYVVELRSGQLLNADIDALTMRTGYTHLNYASCVNSTSVNACFTATHLLDNFSNNTQDQTAIGKFFYNGGHFQKLAAQDLNLGGDNNASLKNDIANIIGTDFSFAYNSPQLAAGVSTTAGDYAFFLRKILSNQLRMHDFLGTNAVCTNPSTCATALSTPIPTTESWHYSLAHWVEDDPVAGDGAFSSPGAFGFYPWIDASKTYYGIVARQVQPTLIGDSVAMDSVSCGRLVRKAWLTAKQQ